MNDKERLQLEEKLLMTCSKAQAINKLRAENEALWKLIKLYEKEIEVQNE